MIGLLNILITIMRSDEKVKNQSKKQLSIFQKDEVFEKITNLLKIEDDVILKSTLYKLLCNIKERDIMILGEKDKIIYRLMEGIKDGKTEIRVSVVENIGNLIESISLSKVTAKVNSRIL